MQGLPEWDVMQPFREISMHAARAGAEAGCAATGPEGNRPEPGSWAGDSVLKYTQGLLTPHQVIMYIIIIFRM